MKTCFIIIAIFTITASFADDVEFRTTVVRNDASVGGEFHLDLEMRITNGTSPRSLNSITADIYYGSELVAWGDDFPGTNWAFGISPSGRSENGQGKSRYAG